MSETVCVPEYAHAFSYYYFQLARGYLQTDKNQASSP